MPPGASRRGQAKSDAARCRSGLVSSHAAYRCACDHRLSLCARLAAPSGFTHALCFDPASCRLFERHPFRVGRLGCTARPLRSRTTPGSHAATHRADGSCCTADVGWRTGPTASAWTPAIICSRRFSFWHSRPAKSAPGVGSGAPGRKCYLPTGVLLVHRNRHGTGMAYSCGVCACDGFAFLAWNPASVIPGRRVVFLVAGPSVVGERFGISRMVSSAVPVRRHSAVRCSFGVPCILRSRGLQDACVHAARSRTIANPGPGVGRRSHVGIRYLYIWVSRGGHHGATPFTSEDSGHRSYCRRGYFRVASLSFSAILTKSASDPACILCIT